VTRQTGRQQVAVALIASSSADWVQARCARLPMFLWHSTILPGWWTVSCVRHASKTASPIRINSSTWLSSNVPFHHWRPFLLCHCRACLEQFACRCHIGPVAVSFQATAGDRTVPS